MDLTLSSTHQGTLVVFTWGIPQTKIVWIKQNNIGLKTKRWMPQNIAHECGKIRR